MKLALQQPYFIPYAGFFRLLAAADLFLIYDNIQFSDSGWVHRNRLTRHDGATDWLTIPLAKKRPLHTDIRDVRFAEDAGELWRKQRRRFRVFDEAHDLIDLVANIDAHKTPSAYIAATMAACSAPHWARVEPCPDIGRDLKGQDRVLAICEHFGADTYINAPGGATLYDQEAFRARGVDLRVLTPYDNKTSMLERLVYEGREAVHSDIEARVAFQ